MERVQFAASIEKAWSLISTLNLHGFRNYSPHFDDHPRRLFKGKPYIFVYKKSVELSSYDFQLWDRSLVQFRYEGNSPLNLSYVYYECPFKIMSKEEFIVSLNFEPQDLDEHANEVDAWYEEYLETVTDQEQKKLITYIRYDYDETTYNRGVHPVSHLHIGYNTEIRIGSTKILSPIAFIMFLIRNCYPEAWKCFHSLDDVSNWERHAKFNLAEINGNFWNLPEDDRELLLS